MELLVQAIPKIEPIKFNYEELKQELTERVQDYKTVVYTADTIKTAKADRAKLNTLKKSLNDERIRLEKEYMEPFQDFKAKVTDLVMIVDEAAKAIDKQVKDYEDLQKKDKQEGIEALFNAAVVPEIPWLGINQVWNEKWLNTTYKTGQIEKDLAEIVARIKSDMEMLGRLPEYSFEAQEMYKQTLNVNDALWQADHLKQMAEAKKAAATITTANTEPQKEEDPVTCMPEPVEPDTGKSEPQRVTLRFEITVTMEEAMKLKKFFETNGIAFRQIV